MPRSLERDLGLYETITISIGAMIGSGIFVLPGLAAKKTGPSVIVAYLLAGLIVLPAALSKSEMATAMPEAGSTYLYIDRAMGPLLGTVAHSQIHEFAFGDPATDLSNRLEATVLLAHPQELKSRSFVRSAIEKFAF
ncbi:hypothetical protein GCM10009006_35430 [Haloarcula argentinensis]|uniref:Amino acid permease/ SLC12A domain-containing protein n=1 Tax=Haloarcula argentinensis TaxID=43776 RepID=A0A830FRP6_HALAR|nr:hypothetical protein GCM10009006_35430 [Haloarcula argentinensis]